MRRLSDPHLNEGARDFCPNFKIMEEGSIPALEITIKKSAEYSNWYGLSARVYSHKIYSIDEAHVVGPCHYIFVKTDGNGHAVPLYSGTLKADTGQGHLILQEARVIGASEIHILSAEQYAGKMKAKTKYCPLMKIAKDLRAAFEIRKIVFI